MKQATNLPEITSLNRNPHLFFRKLEPKPAENKGQTLFSIQIQHIDVDYS